MLKTKPLYRKCFFIALFLITICSSCDNKSYTITCILPDDIDDGKTFYIYNYSDSLMHYIPVDSAVSTESTLIFRGSTDFSENRLLIVNDIYQNFILEKGNINIDLKKMEISGTTLNIELQNYVDEIDSIRALFAKRFDDISINNPLSDDDRTEQINILKSEYNSLNYNIIQKKLTRHQHDALGQYIFLIGIAYDQNTTIESYFTELKKVGNFIANYGPIKFQTKRFNAIQQTQVGQHFSDITLISVDSTHAHISDYIDNQKYNIIELWTTNNNSKSNFKTIKKLYQTHSDIINVISVATDLPFALAQKQIEQRDAVWSNLIDINSSFINTYGISSIPFNLLLDKQGNILARNIDGENIKTWLVE